MYCMNLLYGYNRLVANHEDPFRIQFLFIQMISFFFCLKFLSTIHSLQFGGSKLTESIDRIDDKEENEKKKRK